MNKKNSIFGYYLFGYDNNSYMAGSCDKLFTEPPDIPHCPSCGYKTNYEYTNPLFKLSKKVYDISYTYDGACIVSEKWKSFCFHNKFKNTSFTPLKLAPGFYHFIIKGNTIPFKANTSEFYCEHCHSYNAISGPRFDLEKQSDELHNEIYQTDILFGSGNEKSPLLIVSEETKNLIAEAKLKGCYFRSLL